MADTHRLMKLGIEPAMRQLLADYCGGIDLQQRKMPIRWNGEGTGSFEFDAVSADGRIVACLSTAGNLYPGQLRKLIMDAAFMWLVPDAQRNILAVVDHHVAKKLEALKNRGRLPPKTEIVVLDLPAQMRVDLETFRKIAAVEVGGQVEPL
jgi:hypothetical protein